MPSRRGARLGSGPKTTPAPPAEHRGRAGTRRRSGTGPGLGLLPISSIGARSRLHGGSPCGLIGSPRSSAKGALAAAQWARDISPPLSICTDYSEFLAIWRPESHLLRCPSLVRV